MNTLVCDDDGHWFIVQTWALDVWSHWLNSGQDFEPPFWATPINDPSCIRFDEFEVAK